MKFSKILILICFNVFSASLASQIKIDTVTFSLHCSENEVYVEENLLDQMDTIFGKLGFNDLEYNTKIYQSIIFGHIDNKGSKKTNQLLSEKRAEYVFQMIDQEYRVGNNIVLGFGESKPIAENHTEIGRAKNRRVEVTLIYSQQKINKLKEPVSSILRDTILIFEDGTKLKIKLNDYYLIRNCISYERKTSMYDLFEDLAANDNDDAFYNFGKLKISWCNAKCLDNKITLSIKVPDTLIKAYLKEIKTYVKQLKKQQAKLVKHQDNIWYIDAVSYCPFEFIGCGFHCSFKGKKDKLKKVKYVAKDDFRIVGAFISNGTMFSYKKIKKPKRKIKFKVVCPGRLPVVSVVAINKSSLDTVYFAEDTEKEIQYKKRCFNCIDKNIVIGNFLGIKIHKRLLRRKYLFKNYNFDKKIIRK